MEHKAIQEIQIGKLKLGRFCVLFMKILTSWEVENFRLRSIYFIIAIIISTNLTEFFFNKVDYLIEFKQCIYTVQHTEPRAPPGKFAHSTGSYRV